MKEQKKRNLSGKKLGRPFKYDWSKWDENLTIEENCKKMGMSFTYGYRQCYRYGKKFRFLRQPMV